VIASLHLLAQTIDAKKVDESAWQFREFPRRIVVPNRPAHVGIPWSWTPRIWDPEGRQIGAVYTASPLPDWLSWSTNTHGEQHLELEGTPPAGTLYGQTIIEVTATFDDELDGAQHTLSTSFTLSVEAEIFDVERAAAAASKSRSRTASLMGAVIHSGQPQASHGSNSTDATGPPTPATPMASSSSMGAASGGPNADTLNTLLSQLPPQPADIPTHPQPIAPLSIRTTDLAALAVPPTLSPTHGVPPSFISPPALVGMPGLQQTSPTSIAFPAGALPPPPPLLAPSTTSETATAISELLNPVNLLKEEMAVTTQRPGPIESAVIHHASMTQTAASGAGYHDPAEIQEAQAQVSLAVDAAQKAKVEELLGAGPAPSQGTSPVLDGPVGPGPGPPPPPPTPLPLPVLAPPVGGSGGEFYLSPPS
jgi:hypothetical protein